MSERVPPRYDDIDDAKRVNSCVRKHLFFGGSVATNKIAHAFEYFAA